MTDILAQLTPAAWREIQFPVAHREYGFRQAQAAHRYIFQDNQLIEALGAESPTYRYTVPFREDIAKGPWKNLFTSVYPDFLDAARDRTNGVLDDPVHGSVQCRCVSLRELVDVQRRDGVDIEVEFIYSPDLNDIAGDLGTQIRTLQGAENAAGAFDAAVYGLDDATLAKLDALNGGSPQPTLDPFAFIQSIGDQVDAAQNKIAAKMHDVAFRCDKTSASIDRLKNPKIQPLRRAALRLEGAALRLADTASTPPTPTQVYKNVRDVSLIVLAGTLGTTVEILLKLNGNLRASMRGMLVPAGVLVRHPK